MPLHSKCVLLIVTSLGCLTTTMQNEEGECFFVLTLNFTLIHVCTNMIFTLLHHNYQTPIILSNIHM